MKVSGAEKDTQIEDTQC